MSAPTKSPSPILKSVGGLSSPFDDRQGTSLTSPSHVIDISPSPPPPALRSVDGRFEDALSPDTAHQPEPAGVPTQNKTMEPELKPVSSLPKRSHQAIGLGLGIRTDEGTLDILMDSVHAPTEDNVVAMPVSSFDPYTEYSRLVVKGPLARRIRPNYLRSRVSGLYKPRVSEDRGYLAEDEGDDEDGDEDRHADAPDDDSMSEPYHDHMQSSVGHRMAQIRALAQAQKSSKSTGLLLASTRGPRRLAPVKRLQHEPEEDTSVHVPASQSAHASPPIWMPASEDKGSSGTVLNDPHENLISRLARYRVTARGINDPDSTMTASPVNTGDGPTMNSASFLEPNATSTSTTICSSATPSVASTTAVARNSPMLHPSSSPALSSHSPTLSNTPGSFPPALHDMFDVSPSFNSSQPTGTPVPHSATPLFFSILAGSLGISGVIFVLVAVVLKKSGCCAGMFNWKRKPRGNAYDEFMEDEKSWWMTEYTDEKRASGEFGDEANETGDFSKGETRCLPDLEPEPITFSRSPSTAPSIPPIAHIANGKISLDSIQIGFPYRLPSLSSLKSILSQPGTDQQTVTPITSLEKTRVFSYDADHPMSQAHDFLENIGKNPAFRIPDAGKRVRSGSKSSILSKASMKSISSMASFLLNKTKLEALGGGKKPNPTDLGISNETYRHKAYVTNEDSDNESRASGEITSIGAFHHSIQRVDSVGSFARPTSVHIEQMTQSSQFPEVIRRPVTMTFVPPQILITDHPSELIPPSPPRPPSTLCRPASVGTVLSSYSAASYRSDRAHQNERNSFGIPASPPVFGHEIPSPRNRHTVSGVPLDEPRKISGDQQMEEFMGSPPITSLASLLNYRSRISGPISSPDIEDQIRSTAAFCSPQRSSLSSIASSKTIIELAAVTEDLRALVDSDAEGNCSWSSPRRSHQPVSRIEPPIHRYPLALAHQKNHPPRRPPKSANRYRPREKLAIVYESTSTPSSPLDYNPIFASQPSPGTSNSSSVDPLSKSNREVPRVSSMSRTRPSKSPSTVPYRAAHFRRRTAGSGSSLETVISAESNNSSSFEDAILQTAQTVRGACAEIVIRSPPSTLIIKPQEKSNRNLSMEPIVEERNS